MQPAGGQEQRDATVHPDTLAYFARRPDSQFQRLVDRYGPGASRIADHLLSMSWEDVAALTEELTEYVAAKAEEIKLYGEGLSRLRSGATEAEVGRWLEGVGYDIGHERLYPTLTERTGQALRAVTQAVQYFLHRASRPMPLSLEAFTLDFGPLGEPLRVHLAFRSSET